MWVGGCMRECVHACTHLGGGGGRDFIFDLFSVDFGGVAVC